MKKTLVLTKDDKVYKLTLKGSESSVVYIRKNIINGEDIYNAFYKDTKNSCDTDIETALSEQSDRIIKDQIEQLFKYTDIININIIFLTKLTPETAAASGFPPIANIFFPSFVLFHTNHIIAATIAR